VLKVARLPGKQGAKSKECKHGKYSNALVQANNPQHQITYGMAAARIKFSPVNGQHSAFWMDVPAGGSWTPGDAAGGAEIDIAEYFGDGRRKGGLASFVHAKNAKGEIVSVGGELRSRHLLSKNKKLQKKKEWSQGWHVYSVEWSPTGYVFRVDGKVTLKTSKYVSRVPETILLSAITSDWELPQMNPKRLPTVTKYDWVRVWQRPAA
jgi:beta-glucanase (GH16 family)